VEAARFIPVSRSRVVLALHGWLAGTDTSEGSWVPFYLQPSLGGHNTLRGYADYRFHDRNLLVVNLEARFALFTHVDAAVFADAGNVAPRVSDLDLDKRSYGVGWRLHSRESTFARIDVAHGAEGWRFLFRLSDPLHLSRLTRRLAPVPFVP
jgi:outer membrane protein assembly factor BamA